jgi:hypothetical protein
MEEGSRRQNSVLDKHERRFPFVFAGLWEGWKDPSAEAGKEILVPYPVDRMTAWSISDRLNSPKNDDSEIFVPVELQSVFHRKISRNCCEVDFRSAGRWEHADCLSAPTTGQSPFMVASGILSIFGRRKN